MHRWSRRKFLRIFLPTPCILLAFGLWIVLKTTVWKLRERTAKPSRQYLPDLKCLSSKVFISGMDQENETVRGLFPLQVRFDHYLGVASHLNPHCMWKNPSLTELQIELDFLMWVVQQIDLVTANCPLLFRHCQYPLYYFAVVFPEMRLAWWN